MAGSPDARRGRPTGAAPGRSEAASQKLAEHLHQISAEAPAPEDALEPALRAILEACGATAGAICLFDQRNEMLRLAAEVGLSDEGCRQLRSVRRGGVGAWDMPLHSLLNRRAYLIESAAKNRYVPPLVEPAASVRTLACVPLYAGSTPLASLILVAMIPASFSERDIRVLDQAIRELVKMIESVRRRAPGQASGSSSEPAEAPPPPAPTMTTRRPQPRATVSPELSVTPGAAPGEAASPPATAAPDAHATTEVLATALAESERERTRLATALEQAQAKAGGTVATPSEELTRALQAVEAAEAGHATAAAEAEAARVEATRCRAEIQRLETAEREHTEERTRLEQALAAATARTADDGSARAQLDAELAEARAGLARLADVERERDALATERDRLHEAAAAAGDAEAARAEVAHIRAALDTTTAEVERLRAEITALTAATDAARAEQARLEQELVAERHRGDARAGALEQELSVLRTEREADAARLAELTAERDTLREAAAAASEAEAAQAALTAAQATIDHLHGELESVRTDVERLTTAERDARDAMARAAQEALDARTRMEQEAAEALAREREALETQLAALRAERDDAAAAIGVEREDAARERETLREQLVALEARLVDVTAASEAAAGAAEAADAARAELAALQATVDELRNEGTLARGELDRLATVERDLLADRSRLEQSLQEAQEAAATAAAPPDPGAVASDDVEIEIEDAEAVLTMEPPPDELAEVPVAAPETEPAAEPGAEAAPLVTADQTPRVVILDVEAAWDGLDCSGHQVTRLAPEPDAVSRIVALAPQRLVVNLAVAGALETLHQLRGAGVTGTCWGVIAAPGAPTVLPLALVDASHRPLDPDAVIATMAPYAAQGTRVVTVGADVDALISLRQALARQGLSVSMAWNAKQADDLLGMVKPQVAVVDLDLPQRDGYGIVAKLAAMSPVPTMLLVQGVEEAGARFAALLVDPSHRERMTGRDKVLATVAAWQPPVVKEKRSNVRTIR